MATNEDKPLTEKRFIEIIDARDKKEDRIFYLWIAIVVLASASIVCFINYQYILPSHTRLITKKS